VNAVPPDRTLTVVVADAHEATRAGIAMALRGHRFEVVAEAESAAATVEAALRERPDFCVMDADLRDAVAAAAEVAGKLPDTAVVMLAGTVDDDRLFAALRAGAQGYLLKDMDAGRLPHALRGVMAGEAALPRTLVTRLIDELRGQSRRRHSAAIEGRGIVLTAREWDVAEMLRAGLSTRQMADRMAISPVTVRRHVSELLRKLDAPSRGALVEMLDGTGVQD
jgi:DNA-binding NarL/FixJ family response regulator